MARKQTKGKQVTRYVHRDAHDPRTPETGHTPLLPGEEQVVTLDMDNGWSRGLEVAKLEDGRTVLVDMDPAVDPVLMWAGKRNRRDIPVLPLQRNEVVSESRIAQIIARAQRSSESGASRQGSLFAELEKEVRESEKDKRVEFYTHEEEWKNKLICGDSLPVMESLIKYEGLAGKVQMVYIDPPYGVRYDANFQQRIDTTKIDSTDTADDVVAITAYRDTWSLGVHSYLEYLKERLYLARELLSLSGSIFVQMGEDNAHIVRVLMDEVFGAVNYVSEIVFMKTSSKGSLGIDAVYDRLIWYARDRERLKYRQLYRARPSRTLEEQYTLVEELTGEVRRMTAEEKAGLVELPPGARRFMPGDLSSQGETDSGSRPYRYEGKDWYPPPGRHWSFSVEGLDRLNSLGRLIGIGKRLRSRRYADDFPLAAYTNLWDDTVISGYGPAKLYVVHTSPKVVARCIAMTTDPGDLVFDPTCGSGTTAYCAESLARRWITCETSRVAVNVARQRLLSGVFNQYRLTGTHPSEGLAYDTVPRVTLKSLAYDLEPEMVELVDTPVVDPDAVRVSGPFELLTLGRYSLEDWQGSIEESPKARHEGRLDNYVRVMARLYRSDCEVSAGTGLVHAVVDSTDHPLAISIGPLTGRVTARQVHGAVEDAASLRISNVHVLGWAFEANVGEMKSQIDAEGEVDLQLVMIRPDALAEGLKITRPEELFTPLALPEITIDSSNDGVTVSLSGVGLFNRKTRKTDYHRADSGYIAAWYLDEDYDGDCFVDCQMFFDFKRAPNLTQAIGSTADPEEFDLTFTSEPFEPGQYRRVAVKVVDVYGNESTVVRSL